MPLTAGRAVVQALEDAGIRHAFTVPGESFLEILDALRDSRIRLVAARHEAGAGFMAAGYAQLSGEPAACLVTRAVGTANLSIALHAARADSTPLVAIAGQVRRDMRGRESFQEADLVASFGRLCKDAAELGDARTMAERVAGLVRRARDGRPGPVLIAVPEDALEETIPDSPSPGDWPSPHGPAWEPARPGPRTDQVREVLRLLAAARWPVVLAGGGVRRGQAADALVAFAEAAALPVISTWRRTDVFPNESPRYLGSTGLASPATVRARLAGADVILAMGTRLPEIATFGYAIPGAGTRLVHVDLEPSAPEAGRSPRATGAGSPGDSGSVTGQRPVTFVRADPGTFLRDALIALRDPRASQEGLVPVPGAAGARARELAGERAAFLAASELPDLHGRAPGRGVHPASVVRALRRRLPAGTIVATDAGNFAGWIARYLPVPPGGRFLGPTSGAMGFGLPAGVGAAIADRDLGPAAGPRQVVVVAGDGGFAMLMAEVETAVRERLRLAAIVFDNGMYGTIRAHQERAHPGRVAATGLGPIDLSLYAAACGARGCRVERDADVDAAVAEALDGDGVALVHVLTDPDVLGVDQAAQDPLQAGWIEER